MKTVIKSSTAQATEHIAEKIGQKLIGGEIIELVSDLGGGKTTFVRGLSQGLGSHDRVSSPSFTIANQYGTSELRLYHFDFYRLNDPGIVANELAEVLTDPKAIVVVEWANIVGKLLSRPHLTIHFDQTGDSTRNLTLTYPKTYSYLF